MVNIFKVLRAHVPDICQVACLLMRIMHAKTRVHGSFALFTGVKSKDYYALANDTTASPRSLVGMSAHMKDVSHQVSSNMPKAQTYSFKISFLNVTE